MRASCGAPRDPNGVPPTPTTPNFWCNYCTSYVSWQDDQRFLDSDPGCTVRYTPQGVVRYTNSAVLFCRTLHQQGERMSMGLAWRHTSSVGRAHVHGPRLVPHKQWPSPNLVHNVIYFSKSIVYQIWKRRTCRHCMEVSTVVFLDVDEHVLCDIQLLDQTTVVGMVKQVKELSTSVSAVYDSLIRIIHPLCS
eukprot:363027-Chlamydomonas_euryale.AAC.2